MLSPLTIERLHGELVGRDCVPRSAKEKEGSVYHVMGIVLGQYPIRAVEAAAIGEAMSWAGM